MIAQARSRRTGPLLPQLRWFVRLRWLAGVAVILGAMLDWRWLDWYPPQWRIAVMGAVILGYNVLLHLATRRARALVRRPQQRGPPKDGVQQDKQTRQGPGEAPSAAWLVAISWLQLLLDLGCLTLLVLWTGGVYSPFLGFYVFHMVFSSLLLPRRMAYGAATAAIVMASAGLAATQLWPDNLQGALIGVGWAVTLFLTVYLANEITQGLRRQRQRLARQKNRILAMSEQLRRQQGAMIQHEKMVALGQMAAGIAHEIANPLACMDSLLELMRRHPRHEVPVRVATVREQIRRIEQIIQQMSAFAHPGQSHGQMLGVNHVVEAALSMVRFDHRIRRVRVEQQFSDDAAGVQVESQTLVQVIVNLVMNALDAMDGSPAPRLVLRTACEGDWCLIEVADNGHGVAPEHVDHIFEPFFTTKSVGKGTGLGLAISYSLVRRLGGRIDLRTEVGKGTSFVIRWPISAMVSYSRESPAL